jgi:glycosyltransferase involved in cell wall biosynthesis
MQKLSSAKRKKGGAAGSNRLTLVAVFYNEEKKLGGYFKNVSGVADSAVVVDCSSSDRTAEISRKNGAVVIGSPLRYFEQNVNRALERAEGDWILILDADERLSEGLKKEIGAALRRDDVDVFLIKRINYLFDGFSAKSSINAWLPRLFRKGCVRWEQEMPHENPRIAGRVGRLGCVFYHYAYPDLPAYVKKMEEYLCRLPAEYAKKGQKRIRLSDRDSMSLVFGRHGWRRMFLYPPFVVMEYLLLRRLLLDGTRGIVFSYCAGAYAFFEEAVWWGEKARAAQGAAIDWGREYPEKG